MKVALIMQRTDTRRGGAETSLVQYVEHLTRRGCKVHLYTADSPQLPDGVALHTIRANSPLRTLRAIGFVRQTTAALHRESYDIVHAISPFPDSDIYQPRGGVVRQTGRANVAACRSRLARTIKRLALSCNLQHRLMLRLERQTYGRPHLPLIAAVSRYVADQVEQHYGVGPARLRVVFNGVDCQPLDPQHAAEQRQQARQRLGIDHKTVLALFVAHNFKLKGLASAIRALAELTHAPRKAGPGPEGTGATTKLMVVGHDNSRSYRRLAARLGVADHTVFVGAMDRIWQAFHAADLLVHPTFYDACSRVVLEALASGLPVVTTTQNGAAELITDGREGYLIESGQDVAGLARAWSALLDPELRGNCSRYALQRRDELSMEHHVDQMLQLYREVITSRSDRS